MSEDKHCMFAGEHLFFPHSTLTPAFHHLIPVPPFALDIFMNASTSAINIGIYVFAIVVADTIICTLEAKQIIRKIQGNELSLAQILFCDKRRFY